MPTAIAILGTASDVGKSMVSAGLCRILFRQGIRVAPFKSQNMSLNSYVTLEGGEMGRAQVLQAQACGVMPHVDMNPILLKPEADSHSQVIVQGKVWGTQDAKGYFGCKRELFHAVQESYARLAAQYDVLVIEGAGSAAELNLRDRDLVNWSVVEMADARVILVADIDRGGVFAQIIGTLDLLDREERERVIGVVINKFRGDRSLFDDGVKILEDRTQLPVLGVIPFLRGLELDEEDSVRIDTHQHIDFEENTINIAVVLLPRMSNFTDFKVLAAEADLRLRYVKSPRDLMGADVVILPGTKHTINDLQYLKEMGFPGALVKHVGLGRELVGVCGGFQMLGETIADPHGVEGGGQETALQFLPMETELESAKQTRQIQAQALFLNHHLAVGYEIHMGVTRLKSGISCFRMQDQKGEREDGCRSPDGLVWGTYIHGVFDAPTFRRAWVNRVRIRKGLSVLGVEVSEQVNQRLSSTIDRWADHVEQHVNMKCLFGVVGRFS